MGTRLGGDRGQGSGAQGPRGRPHTLSTLGGKERSLQEHAGSKGKACRMGPAPGGHAGALAPPPGHRAGQRQTGPAHERPGLRKVYEAVSVTRLTCGVPKNSKATEQARSSDRRTCTGPKERTRRQRAGGRLHGDSDAQGAGAECAGRQHARVRWPHPARQPQARAHSAGDGPQPPGDAGWQCPLRVTLTDPTDTGCPLRRTPAQVSLTAVKMWPRCSW